MLEKPFIKKMTGMPAFTNSFKKKIKQQYSGDERDITVAPD